VLWHHGSHAIDHLLASPARAIPILWLPTNVIAKRTLKMTTENILKAATEAEQLAGIVIECDRGS
jgi:hypothetical protein